MTICVCFICEPYVWLSVTVIGGNSAFEPTRSMHLKTMDRQRRTERT